MEKLSFTDKKGLEIIYYKWVPKEKITGVIVISHGMTEWIGRYDYFAKKMNDSGYIVYGHSHRGHGETALSKELLGYIAEKDGFELLVENLNEMVEIAKGENENLPLILFGHSMGSFVAQRFVQKYSNKIDALILSGTNGKPKSYVRIGEIIAGIEMKIRGRKKKSPLMNYLSFGNFNSHIKNPKTEYDWLCGNEIAVNEYIQNEYCGFICTTSFYYDLIKSLFNIHKNKNMNSIRRDLPIYIFAGDKDPVGYFGEGIKNLFSTFKNLNIKNVEYKLYQNGRHEMLNEKNKDTVIEDIKGWIEGNL